MSVKYIGLLGPDSTGKKLGAQASTVKDALRKKGYCVVVSHDGIFDNPELLDAVFAVGKYPTGIESVIALCTKRNLPMLGVGKHMADIDPEGSFVYVHAPKLSRAVFQLYRDIYEHKGLLVQMREYQQNGKELPSAFVSDIVGYVKKHRPKEDVAVACFNGIEHVPEQYRSNIPQEYYSDFSIYEARFFMQGSTTLEVVEIYGRKDAAVCAVKIAQVLLDSSLSYLLDMKRYPLRYLVHRKII